MTDEQDTTIEAAGKLLTAEQVKAQRPRLIAWLKQNGADDPENTAGDVELVIAKKYLGKPLVYDDPFALAVTIAKNELSDERRENTSGVPRNRRVLANEGAVARAADTREPEADHERRNDGDKLVKEYAERVGISIEVATELVEEGKVGGEVVGERLRLRKPGHFFEDEQDQLRETALVLCDEEYKNKWQIPWDKSRAAHVELLLNGRWRGNAAAELAARKVLAELKTPLEKACSIAETTMRDIEGTPTVGGSAVKHLCAWKRPLAMLLESVQMALEGPDGYLKSELHNFIACTFTRQDYAAALGCSSRPEGNDLAAIWLLSGGAIDIRPDTWTKNPDGMTAGQYREKARDAVRAAVKHYSDAPPELP